MKFRWIWPYGINSCEMIRLYFSSIKCVWHCCKAAVNDHVCVDFMLADVINLVLCNFIILCWSFCFQFHQISFVMNLSLPRWSMALSTAVEWEILSAIHHSLSSVLCKGSHRVSTQGLPSDEWFHSRYGVAQIILQKIEFCSYYTLQTSKPISVGKLNNDSWNQFQNIEVIVSV